MLNLNGGNNGHRLKKFLRKQTLINIGMIFYSDFGTEKNVLILAGCTF